MNLIGKILLFFLFNNLTLNASITVSAWVDRKSIPINESFTLTISVTSNNTINVKPEIPSLLDFNIYSSGKTSNISIINGQISTTVEFSYTLVPKRTGKFKIPRIGIFTGNEKYFTNEIEVEITPPSFTNQPSSKTQIKSGSPKHTKANLKSEDLVFVKAYTDKTSAYPQEQITLTIRFYTALPISSNPQYIPPSYSNLIAEELPPVRTGTEVLNGIRYYYAEVKTALFPIMPQQKTLIHPAKIIAYAQTQEDEDLDPFDPNFIQKFFSQGLNTREIKLETKPIELNIKDLPPPPPDFSNAVGNFFITAKTEQNVINLGDALNLIVEISGKGNVKSINYPKIQSPDFKIYDVLSSETISKNNDIIGGTKKFTYIISPLKEGEIRIEPIKFTFFNIDTKQYETIYTKPLTIKVNKAKDGKTYDFDKTPLPSDIVEKEQDINYIYEKIPSTFVFILSDWFYKYSLHINILLAIILIISYAITKKRDIIANNPLEYEYKKALTRFKDRIREIKSQKDFQKQFALLYDTIYDYISAKLKKNITHLTFSKLKDEIKLAKPDFSDELLENLKSIIEKIEFFNYAPSKITEEDLERIINDLIETIQKMEKEFSK